MANQGWQCPECKTVYAPHVDKCECAKDSVEPVQEFSFEEISKRTSGTITIPVDAFAPWRWTITPYPWYGTPSTIPSFPTPPYIITTSSGSI